MRDGDSHTPSYVTCKADDLAEIAPNRILPHSQRRSSLVPSRIPFWFHSFLQSGKALLFLSFIAVHSFRVSLRALSVPQARGKLGYHGPCVVFDFYHDLPSFLHPYSFSHELMVVVHPHLLKLLSTEPNSSSVQFSPFLLVCAESSQDAHPPAPSPLVAYSMRGSR